jgi:hypothetical protein
MMTQKKIAFEVEENYLELLPLPARKCCTKYARYIGITSNFICSRGFPAVLLRLLEGFPALPPPFLFSRRTLSMLSRLTGGAAVGQEIVRV